MSGVVIELFEDPPGRRRSGARRTRGRSGALRAAWVDLGSGIRSLLGFERSRPEVVDALLHAAEPEGGRRGPRSPGRWTRTKWKKETRNMHLARCLYTLPVASR